ncbi:SARP family transcriptional regulator [Nereida sp. MMG025]|uniref:SARP family transcriptional regulator n=1 Tax=Nereida sp. MMG025 TaxID=2909981 RepID=UPI001F29943D|nr:SARP family transcriptional regulator [Nereida sp. MMG025]
MKNTLPGDPPLIKLFLFGPVTVIGEDGQDLTPKSKKARAILAMLALAPRGVRSRVWLRHQLWSIKNEDQAANSLRQSLSEIRRALGPVEKRCMQADKNTVALNLSIIDVDYMRARKADGDLDRSVYAPEQLLEDLDIADAEFEAWLRNERDVWAARLNTTSLSLRLQPRVADKDTSLVAKPATYGVGEQTKIAILPSMLMGETRFTERLMPQAHGYLRKGLDDIGDFRCIEPQGTQTDHWSHTPKDWIAVLPVDVPVAFQFRGFQTTDQIHMALQMQHIPSGRMIWSLQAEPVSIASSYQERAVHGLISAGLDATQSHLLTELPQLRDANICTNALATMMRLSAPDIDKAETILTDGLATKPTAQIHSLMAFLLTFRIGQRFQFEDAALIDRAQDHTSQALKTSAENALVQTLTAHVHSYLFGEYDFAAGLFEKALRRNPTQVLAWDLYSMLHAYAGQPSKALAMANWACHLGAQSPNRYYFETTRAITACFSGQHETALKAGEFALTERPEFNSILRVLVSSSAHLGRIELAHSYLQRLRQVEPDFTIEALREAGYPGLETDGGKHFVEGLLKAGVKPS